MKKTTFALFLLTSLIGANALATDIFTERQELVKKLKSSSHAPVEIGYYPGSASKDELFYWSQKYLPFANYLSNKTDSLVTLVPEPNVRVLKNLVKAQRYQWIYTNPEVAVLAQEIAYTPVLKQSTDIDSVLVVRPDSRIKKYSDLQNMKLGIVKATITGTYARYKLNEVKTTPLLVDVPEGQSALFSYLDHFQVDAIAVRRDLATAAMEKNPNKYQIVDIAGTAPGFVLSAHTSVPQEEIERVRSAFLKLHAEDKDANHIMSLYGDKLKEGPYFVEWDRDFLKTARKAVAYVEPDYGRYVYNPSTGKYTEAYTLFAEAAPAPATAAPASAVQAPPAAAVKAPPAATPMTPEPKTASKDGSSKVKTDAKVKPAK